MASIIKQFENQSSDCGLAVTPQPALGQVYIVAAPLSGKNPAINNGAMTKIKAAISKIIFLVLLSFIHIPPFLILYFITVAPVFQPDYENYRSFCFV